MDQWLLLTLKLVSCRALNVESDTRKFSIVPDGGGSYLGGF